VLRAGGRGYLSKLEPSSSLIEAIHELVGGGIYLSRKTKSLVLRKIASHTGSAHISPVDTLADRELEVLRLLGQGYNGPAIAEALSLGQKTVDTYRTRIKEKLGLRNAADLYNFAARWIQDCGA
jgi:DNA-binding NarL/FixJ family response regulator